LLYKADLRQILQQELLDMQIKAEKTWLAPGLRRLRHRGTSKNYILISLLLCSWFLASYISVLNTAAIISSDVNAAAVSSMSGGNGQSSMNGAANTRHLDYMAEDTAINFFIASLKQSRDKAAKTGFNTVTVIIAALVICLLCASRLSGSICSQFSSLKITFFLHKKDGMK